MRLITTALFVLFSISLSAQRFEPDAKIPFKETDKGDLLLHVFYPEEYSKDSRYPAAIFFFGGGWTRGNPSQFYPHSEYLASRGMVAISAQYRTKESHGTTPRECLKDAKSAIRWLRNNADELAIDPDLIVAGGGSAGGHLAAAAATLSGYNEPGEDTSVSSVPIALLLFNPVYDTSARGYGHERVSDFWKSFSPMHNLTTDTPPSIVFFGTEDHLIPVSTAEEFKAMNQKNGVSSDLHLYEGYGHGFFNYGNNEDIYWDTIEKTDQFLVELGILKSKD